MRNIFLFLCKIGIVVVPFIAVTTLFACVDKIGEADLNPDWPTKEAEDIDDSGNNQGESALYFPTFEDGVLAILLSCVGGNSRQDALQFPHC